MKRKPMGKKDTEKLAKKASEDEEQELWEKKKLGNDSEHAARSPFYKQPSKLISIRVPDNESLREAIRRDIVDRHFDVTHPANVKVSHPDF